MKDSVYKSYEELPLFLNAKTVARVLGISPSSSYELMHQRDFPTLKIGNRIVVPKERFVQWVEQNTSGGNDAEYTEEPTKYHASEFIASTLESYWPEVNQSETYMKYIATRPRVERLGSLVSDPIHENTTRITLKTTSFRALEKLCWTS